MYRALPSLRRVAFTSRNGLVRVTRRRMATESPPTPTIPKKKRHIIRRVFWATAGVTGTFYVGSTFIAFYNQTYYDFFSDHVPLGQPMLEYAEAHKWDTLTVGDVIDSGKQAVVVTQRFVTDLINGTKSSPEPAETLTPPPEKKRTYEPRVVRRSTVNEAKERVESVAKEETERRVDNVTDKSSALAKHEGQQFSDDLLVLVRKAEDALVGHIQPPAPMPMTPVPVPSATPLEEVSQEEEITKDLSKNIYEAPLPVGFEPPPGYSRPLPPKPTIPASDPLAPVSLPLIAPVVSSLNASEPIIIHLAGTIDNLATYLVSNPATASKVSDVLDSAKQDLTSLADRIEKAREEERIALESKLDEQTREYTLKMMELEIEAQDRLDNQQEDFGKLFDEERTKIVQAYRAKLEQELRTQYELINERLKEEVIAQGIELQRRWIREIKVRVEQERGGRLGKLEELSSHLKRLERVALDNSTYLDENIRVHNLWSALRSLTSSALSSSVRKPFREELRILRHIEAAREDPVVGVALEILEASEVPDVGVEPFRDLASWFVSDVAPKVSHVALVPEENAGVLSYLASHLFSGLRFRRHGLVNGDDVLSVIARAEHYLNEKDLDSAARELNQLNGPAKILLHDWLEAARRRLEVEQVLEVVQTQATLASLLVI